MIADKNIFPFSIVLLIPDYLTNCIKQVTKKVLEQIENCKEMARAWFPPQPKKEKPNHFEVQYWRNDLYAHPHPGCVDD
ncbi:MAG: hypothetical protein ROW48_08405 [Bellilinea sp.]|jgi:hypothetical protein